MTIPPPDDRNTLVDPRVDRAWREISRDEPSASLDAALLAAARREAGAKPQPVGARETMAARRQWWPFAAAATVAAIAVGVLQLATEDQVGAPATEQAVVSDMPRADKAGASVNPAPVVKATPQSVAPAPPAAELKAAGSSAAPVRKEVARTDASPRRAPTGSAPEPMRQEPAPPLVSSPAPEPFPAAPKLAADAVKASAAPFAEPVPPKEMPRAPAAAGIVTAERASSAPATAPAPIARRSANVATSAANSAATSVAIQGTADAGAADTRAKDRAQLPIPEWIAHIRRLRNEGKTADAAKELAAFRTAHADHEKLLPPDLRDWRPPEMQSK